MRKKKSFNIPPKVYLIIFTFICFVFIGFTFFTDVFTKPLSNITASVIIPMQKGVNGIGLWLSERTKLFESVEELQAENAELKAKIDELSSENVRLKSQQEELRQLQDLYDLDEVYSDYAKTAANVIGGNYDNWYNNLIIDKGTNDGIKVDMNVIADDGLVGIVTQAFNNYSIVRSIIDDNSSVSAMTLNTSDICVVSGDLQKYEQGYIDLSHISANVKVRDGDMIVTSNISDKYLQGLLIGYAKGVTKDANDLTQSGYIIPTVDFQHITKVLVILELKTDTSGETK